MSISNHLKNGKLISSRMTPVKDNVPSRYSDRQNRYYADESSAFLEEYAMYSSDYVEAEVQGLLENDPYGYTTVHVRLAEVVKPSATLLANFDDYKQIIVAERWVDYIRRGAKIKCMGSTWIVTNPANISGGDGNAIIQRCDASWRYLDYYGNICVEPLCVEHLLTRANDNDAQRSVMVTKGYFDIKCQYNDATRQLSNNSRIILGRSAYRITGFSDFAQEFTDDYDSVGLIAFTARYEEPNMAIDDMENKVAGGKTFNWNITISGSQTFKAGETVKLSATSERTYGEKTEEVVSTREHPFRYMWKSSNPRVAKVSLSGDVRGVSEGQATIYAILAENPSVKANITVTVAGDESEPHVKLNSNPTEVLHAFETEVISATYFENGEATNEEITWELSGADEDAYSYAITDNSIAIKCWAGSVEKLNVVAKHGTYSKEFSIELIGV